MYHGWCRRILCASSGVGRSSTSWWCGNAGSSKAPREQGVVRAGSREASELSCHQGGSGTLLGRGGSLCGLRWKEWPKGVFAGGGVPRPACGEWRRVGMVLN